MIDGVKIEVSNISASDWLDNDLLDFYTYTNTKTGELKDGTRVAKYNALTFVITASVKYPNTYYYSVRGSLHKYFNNGKSNANDFTIFQLKEVIKDLQRKFRIDPTTACLRNLEFGVNIYTGITAKALINNLVAHHSDPFTDLKVQGIKVGKGIGKQRYSLKIYDKGKQENLPVKNLVRFEIAVTKMHYLKAYRIETLSNLLHLENVQPLGYLLLDYWHNAIYYDKQINWKVLTDFERKKILYYATPRNWAEFTRKQRLRAKAHFQNLIAQFGTTSTHQETEILIGKKWNDLTAVKCPRLNHDFLKIGSNDLSTFEPLECTVKTYPNQLTEIKQKKVEKMPPKNPTVTTEKSTTEKPNFCRTCANDITSKKSNSLYCSKRCNNSYHAKQRKKKRHLLKVAETEVLKKLLANINRSRLLLLVEYRYKETPEAIQLYQKEINAPYSWVRKVVKVTILRTGVSVTSYRAKKLIKTVSNLNI